MLNDVLRIYSNDEKYLILNPLVPAWIVTNIAGVFVIKTYGEMMSFEKTAEICCSQNASLSKDSVLKFLNTVQTASLFVEKPIEHIHKPYFLNALYLNMTQKCNLHCTYCYATSRKEHGKENLDLNDYKRILLEAKSISEKIDVIFTGGEPLLSGHTLDVARFAKVWAFVVRFLRMPLLLMKIILRNW